jgi:hypothetical protein
MTDKPTPRVDFIVGLIAAPLLGYAVPIPTDARVATLGQLLEGLA